MSTATLHHLLPRGTVRLLTWLMVHPEQSLHFRALKQCTGLGTGALQRELVRLEGMGLITREARDGRVYVQVVREHPSWAALRELLRGHADPVDVVRDAFADVDGVKAAFVFGSTARGDAHADSDIDLVVVGDGVPLEQIGRATLNAERLLERPLDVRRYTTAALARKRADPSPFLREVLSGPKAWIIGGEEALA